MTAAGTPTRFRVLVAEPDEIVATVLLQCLRDDAFVAARVPADTRALEAAARAHEADVVMIGPGLADPALPIVAARMLASGTRTLVVANRAEHEVALPLLLAGASGLVLIDDASGEEIAQAVRSVASGTTALHPSVVEAVLARWRAGREPAAAPAAEVSLTNRELEVLAGLNEGLSNRLIANRLGVAEKTVEAHKSRLYAKLNARNQAHAVRIAKDRNLLPAPSTGTQKGGHET